MGANFPRQAVCLRNKGLKQSFMGEPNQKTMPSDRAMKLSWPFMSSVTSGSS